MDAFPWWVWPCLIPLLALQLAGKMASGGLMRVLWAKERRVISLLRWPIALIGALVRIPATVILFAYPLVVLVVVVWVFRETTSLGSALANAVFAGLALWIAQGFIEIVEVWSTVAVAARADEILNDKLREARIASTLIE